MVSRGGTGDRTPPGKSQVVISFLRNTGTNPPREAINPCHAEYFLCATLLPNAVFHLSEKCIFKQSEKSVDPDQMSCSQAS